MVVEKEWFGKVAALWWHTILKLLMTLSKVAGLLSSSISTCIEDQAPFMRLVDQHGIEIQDARTIQKARSLGT